MRTVSHLGEIKFVSLRPGQPKLPPTITDEVQAVVTQALLQENKSMWFIGPQGQ